MTDVFGLQPGEIEKIVAVYQRNRLLKKLLFSAVGQKAITIMEVMLT